MADQKITELTALASVDDTADVLPIADTSASTTKKITLAVILTWLNAVVQTLTNKSIDLANNTLTGTKAQFNTAMSDADFATLAGTETLTNKTLTAPTLTTPALGTPASGVMTNVTGLPEAGLTLADNTTNDASTTKHGFLKKLSNVATEFMNGAGNWATPSITEVGGVILSKTNTDVDTHSTNTEQTLFSFSLAGGVLGTGGGVRIVVPINNLDLATDRSMTFNLKYGATTIASFSISTLTGGATPSNNAGHLEAVLFGNGATNAQFGFLSGTFCEQSGGTAAAPVQSLGGADDGTAAEDSTGALTIAVTVQNTESAATSGCVALGGYALRLSA